MDKENTMNLEEEIKQLKSDNFWFKVMLSIVILTVGLLAVGTVKNDSKLAVKTAEVASKSGVECVTKTNTLFGILTKVKIVK